MQKAMNYIELKMWDIATPLLSESRFVRSVVKLAYQVSRSKDSLKIPLTIFSWACLGLILGIILGKFGITLH
jgi:hypothetical protein